MTERDVETTAAFLYENLPQWVPLAMRVPGPWEPWKDSPVYDLWRARAQALLENLELAGVAEHADPDL